MDRSTDPITEFTSKKHPQFLAAGVGKILIFPHETVLLSKCFGFSLISLSVLATLGALGLGTVLGYTSPALPDLKNSTTFSHLDETTHSWIGSVAPVK